jgi:TolA-binding protein
VAEINAFLAKPYSASVGSSRSTYEESVKRRKAEMEGKSRAIEQLKSSPGYDMDILLRVGRCYADMQRKWPAYAVFRRMYKSAPDHALAEDARFQSFMIAAEMDRLEEAVQEGTSYMARHPSGKFLDEVSLNLMQVYLKANKLDLAEAAGFKALDLSPNHRFVDQVKYLLGYIYFQKMDYADALALFQEVLERWPQGTYREAADYWIAMSHLFLGQYESAVTAFSEYLNNPVYAQTGRFAEDAAYRLGVAQYGAGKYAESEGTFRRFIEKYPASDLRSEAYSMVGDLRGAEGDLDVALSYYAMGRDAAGDNIAQINYAVFQAASVYELLGRHSEIIILMEGYLQKHGEKGNYAGAGFWIGKAYTAMGQREKALQKYIETVVRFGDKPENDQVDLIIRELIKEHDSEGGWAGRVEIKKQLESRLAEARAQKQTTLALRLATLFANITIGTERQRYVDEILAENNVKEAGAITLLLIAGEAARRGDADLVHRTYQHCLEAYPESDILVDVMNTELLMLFEKGEYQKVADLAEEITLKFGYRTEVGLTRKLKADALRLSGKYSEAFVTYQELFAVRDWRGPMTVEALYWMGYCNFQQGKTEEAFTFFQRLYVLYEKQTEWAAKSYEAAILCHEKLGRTEDVIRTCDEMLANPRIAATPEGQRAKERLAVLRPEGGRK